MAATARVVEMVGVGAYLGAASLVSDPQLLTAAASILTVEARHQTMLNVLSGSGAAIPQAFDIPLSPSQVLAIAGGFIQPGCDLGVPGTCSCETSQHQETDLVYSRYAFENHEHWHSWCWHSPHL